MTVTIERESVEALDVTISAKTDPTGNVVEFAFTAPTARPSAYTAGTWTSPAVLANGRFTATATTPLLGTGGLDLTQAEYQAWCRITSGSEVAVFKVGRVKVA